MPDLIVKSVTKSYPTRTEPLVVLQDVSFSLSAGENAAIIGPSGSGKSTLLHVIGALEAPTEGEVTLGGENPYLLSERALASFRNHNIGFVFQDHHLLPQLSVMENVLVPAIAEGRPSPDLLERSRMLIDRVGLGKRLDHRPAELSGGERERVAVARSLILSPRLLLADEPTGNLDRKNAEMVGELLVKLQSEQNTMLIVVTHSMDLAKTLGRQWELDDGRLVS